MAKVLFAQEIYYPFHGTSRLSAYLKQNNHMVVLVIGDERKIVKHIKKTEPDLIAFSVLSLYRNHMLSTSAAIKSAGIKTPIIAGGYDITFLPELLEHSFLDIICRGEGEEPLNELCNCIDNGHDYTNIPNLWVKKGDKIFRNKMRLWFCDLDKLPFVDRDIYLEYDGIFKIIPFFQMMAGRGCPYNCNYCFNHKYKTIYQSEGSKGYCLLRSVDNVIEELLFLKNKYKAGYFFFNDSTLAYNKKWLIEFLQKHKQKIQVPFSINVCANEVNEEMGKALSENGYCKLVRFGLESGNEDLRLNVLKKRITDKQFIQATDILKKYNVKYSMTMMIVLPGETLEAAWDTIKFAGQLLKGNNTCSIGLFQAYPGLEITNYGVEIGQFKNKDVSGECQLERIKHLYKEYDKSHGKYQIYRETTNYNCQNETYRQDDEGKLILRLSRFSHIAMRHSKLRFLIKQLIKFPDNFIYRIIYSITESMFATRVHANVPFSFFIKYIFFHFGKRTN